MLSGVIERKMIITVVHILRTELVPICLCRLELIIIYKMSAIKTEVVRATEISL